MAQVLKEELREQILDSAKAELLEYGYKDASMRRIAQKAHMTVGNLYRYFKNKEELNQLIVEKCLAQINRVLMEKTSNSLNFSTTEFNLPDDIEQLKGLLSDIIEDLLTIAYQHKIEFKILLMGSQLNHQITQWFKDLIKYFILKKYDLYEFEEKVDIISQMYADAIIAGFNRCLKQCDDEQTAKKLIKAFMISYISMLNNDIEQYI